MPDNRTQLFWGACAAMFVFGIVLAILGTIFPRGSARSPSRIFSVIGAMQIVPLGVPATLAGTISRTTSATALVLIGFRT